MALNPVPDEAYPSATEGEAIPLAAVRPIGSFVIQATANIAQDITLPEEVNLLSIYCKSAFLLKTPTSTSNGTYLSESFYGLSEVNYELVLPKDIIITTLDDSLLVLNLLQKWGQLINIGSYGRS